MAHSLTQNFRQDWLVSAAETNSWAKFRDSITPAFTGTDSWRKYLQFLEGKLSEAGAVDFHHNTWDFDRWWTVDEPTHWGLVSGGKEIKVAFYGANSGSTGPQGITAELIYCDPLNPPTDMKGKIAVMQPMPHPQPPYDENYVQNFVPYQNPYKDGYIENFTFTDYEYRVDDEAFPPIFEYVAPADTISFDSWWQHAQYLYYVALEGQAAGSVIAYDMAYDRLKGIYAVPTPALYDCPTLFLDRDQGAKVIADAKAGKEATLRLDAQVEPAQASQMVAYLPGKDYGTPRDEQILLITHTDGPTVVQENGALGLLAIVKYFSHIPQSERRRTLTVFLDCRHCMPGMEMAHYDSDWFYRFPEKKDPIVATTHIEHLGDLEYREVDGRVEPTGYGEPSYLWVRNNPVLIEAALEAAKQYQPSKLQVSVPERSGVNGGMQQKWWGVSPTGTGDTDGDERFLSIDIPGFGFASQLGINFSICSGIEQWSLDLHMRQVAMMTQLTTLLMDADLEQIEPLKI